MPAERKDLDWDAIERDYRIGIKTLREIASSFGITHGAITRRAKKYEWSRDLSARIEFKREELVSKALVSKSASRHDEVSIIKSKAELQAGAILEESDEIKRLKSIADNFEKELYSDEEDFENPVDFAGIRFDLQKRTSILKQLTEIKEKIINLRRRNLGINDNANGDADKKEITVINNLPPIDAYKSMKSQS
jgi:hypothetical protein